MPSAPPSKDRFEVLAPSLPASVKQAQVGSVACASRRLACIISAAASALRLSTGSKVAGPSPAKSRIVFSAPSESASDCADSVPTSQLATLPVQPVGLCVASFMTR
jgi:hypothetical protein